MLCSLVVVVHRRVGKSQSLAGGVDVSKCLATCPVPGPLSRPIITRRSIGELDSVTAYMLAIFPFARGPAGEIPRANTHKQGGPGNDHGRPATVTQRPYLCKCWDSCIAAVGPCRFRIKLRLLSRAGNPDGATSTTRERRVLVQVAHTYLPLSTSESTSLFLTNPIRNRKFCRPITF